MDVCYICVCDNISYLKAYDVDINWKKKEGIKQRLADPYKRENSLWW